MKKWFTCPELCSRWDCGISDIADIVNDGKLRSYEKNRLEICMYGDGYYVTYKDGSSAFSQEPLTDDHVAELIVHISDLKEYEKKNGIIPRILPTDQPKQGPADTPLVEPAQEKASNNKPISKPKASIVFDEARNLRRDYPKMNKVEAKKKIDEIIKSHKYRPDYTPYSRTQFNRIIKLLGFPPAPRGAKPTNKKN